MDQLVDEAQKEALMQGQDSLKRLIGQDYLKRLIGQDYLKRLIGQDSLKRLIGQELACAQFGWPTKNCAWTLIS
jgi:hypothetical protein